MWFSPRSELTNERTLLLFIIGASCLVHVSFLGMSYLIEYLRRSQPIVFRARKARVTMASLGGSRVNTPRVNTPRVNTPRVNTPRVNTPRVNTHRVNTYRTDAQKVAARKLPSVPKKVPARKVTDQSTTEQSTTEQSTTEQSVPAFSALKKEYTTLKRTRKKEEPKEVVNEQKPKEEPPKEKVLQVPETPSCETQSPEAQSLETQSQAATSSTEVVGQLAYSPESEECTNEVIQEFRRHFNLAPGFAIDEPIRIAFEIKDGKVQNIGPRGSEPLIVYVAWKDALMKSNFIKRAYVENIVFIILPGER